MALECKQTEITTNGSNGRLNIVVLGTGPVGLFLSKSLSDRDTNRVVNLGREGSTTSQSLAERGNIELNTKTIRDLYDMLDGKYTPTEDDPDISIEHPDKPGSGERVILTESLPQKFKKAGLYGREAASAIPAKYSSKDFITRTQLDNIRRNFFRTEVKALETGASGTFSAATQAHKGFEVTNDDEALKDFADIVIVSVKAFQLDKKLAHRVNKIAKEGARVLIAANGINPTLVPKDPGRTTKTLRKALQKIEALDRANRFTRTLEEAGHSVSGTTITFALQLDDNDNSRLVFASTVHNAKLTMPHDPRLEKAFENGKPITIFKNGPEHTKEVLTKLAINQMNIMCAVLGIDKKTAMASDAAPGNYETRRFRELYADIVGQIFDVAAAYKIDLSVDQQGRAGFISHCTGYHDKSVGEGGHKSSTVVDLEKGRRTEAAFLIEAIEQLADELPEDQKPDIHALRIMRRNMNTIEQLAQKGTDFSEEAHRYGQNIIVLPDGTVSQLRRKQDKAEITEQGRSAGIMDSKEKRKSGTYYGAIPAWSYRRGMIESTGLYSLELIRGKGPFEDEFINSLIKEFYDPNHEGSFDPKFDAFEDFLEEHVPDIHSRMDRYVTEQKARAGNGLTGSNGNSGSGADDEHDTQQALQRARDRAHDLTNDNSGGQQEGQIPDAALPRSAGSVTAATPREEKKGYYSSLQGRAAQHHQDYGRLPLSFWSASNDRGTRHDKYAGTFMKLEMFL